MPKPYEKQQNIERTDSKFMDITLVSIVVLIIFSATVWITFVINFGQEIESYKENIDNARINLNSMEQKIQNLDNRIEKYAEILNDLEIEKNW
ncbi:MAG: hypothetical protein ACQESN_02395 [Thermotogota bacterium]